MSKVNHLREFIGQRLTAAAVEILSVFEKTILEYEEELDRQRRLLDLAWKPEIRLHRVELPQENVCKVEEDVEEDSDQHLNNLERSCSPDQEEPGHPQTTEMEEDSSGQHKDVEVCRSQIADCIRTSMTNMHITIQRGSSLPELQRCRTCCDQYHCPFCQSSLFHPTKLSKVKSHLEAHFKRAMSHEGYTIHRCGLQCKSDLHYHCIHCQSILIRRADFIKHLALCKAKHPAVIGIQAPKAPTPVAPAPVTSAATQHATAPHATATTPHATTTTPHAAAATPHNVDAPSTAAPSTAAPATGGTAVPCWATLTSK
ncbi:uncharacterized protein LOC133440346 isoform X2 [Cololabis saira]|uniref:uncharacterized protein LOC133440346 isoform X2 n=1 Tax=Cololabis saira TaxID=129043 RepID=UPI002AD32AA7|nr:uncharacterized protein LOC133440346 isoform X2 [Cololabis saira]